MLREVLPSALDADIFALSNTKPEEGFLSKCYVLEQTIIDQTSTTDTGSGLRSRPWANVVAVVDRSADVPEAALATVTSRISFNGRSFYAPDIIMVNEFVADEFLRHLVQTITAPVYKRNQSTIQHPSNAQSNPSSQTMKELESNSGIKVVMSGANGSIVEVTDR